MTSRITRGTPRFVDERCWAVLTWTGSIYVELADQYKDMDPVSNVVKRNVLADHLREVIDILEQKVRLFMPLVRMSSPDLLLCRETRSPRSTTCSRSRTSP